MIITKIFGKPLRMFYILGIESVVTNSSFCHEREGYLWRIFEIAIQCFLAFLHLGRSLNWFPLWCILFILFYLSFPLVSLFQAKSGVFVKFGMLFYYFFKQFLAEQS